MANRGSRAAILRRRRPPHICRIVSFDRNRGIGLSSRRCVRSARRVLLDRSRPTAIPVPDGSWIRAGCLTARVLARIDAVTLNPRDCRRDRSHPAVRTRTRGSFIREIDDLGRSVSTMRKVVETFSSFVPKRLVQQLIETGTPLGLGGVRREVTIMFTDVADFTALTEHASPERVMSYTSSYFAVLSDAIMSNRGTVDKFIGDAVMALWNAPVEDPDHVINACNAIVACQQATGELNKRFARDNWPAYRTRYGLHVGTVVVGNIGS